MGMDGILHLRSQTLAGVHHEEECGVSTSLLPRIFNVLCASLVTAKKFSCIQNVSIKSVMIRMM